MFVDAYKDLLKNDVNSVQNVFDNIGIGMIVSLLFLVLVTITVSIVRLIYHILLLIATTKDTTKPNYILLIVGFVVPFVTLVGAIKSLKWDEEHEKTKDEKINYEINSN